MPSSRNNRGGRDQERRDREQREEIERLRRIKEEQERVLAELRRKNEIIKATTPTKFALLLLCTATNQTTK